jgi:hypothetical protein
VGIVGHAAVARIVRFCLLLLKKEQRFKRIICPKDRQYSLQSIKKSWSWIAKAGQ